MNIRCFCLFLLLSLFACSTDRKQKVLEQHEDGSTKLIEVYNSEGNKISEIEYYPNGKKYKEMPFSDGLKHGQYTIWHEKGEIKGTGLFKYGKKQDSAFEYNSLGVKSKMFYFKNDTLLTHRNYYESGRPKNELNYVSNKFIAWYENGKIETIIPVSNGDHSEFYSDGIIKMQGEMGNGKRNGIYKYFNEQGEELKEVTYKDGLATDSIIR